MTLLRSSLRRFLKGLFAGVAAWLSLRRSRATTPPRAAPVSTRAPITHNYPYDGVTLGATTTYSYDGNHCLYCTCESSGDHHGSA